MWGEDYHHTSPSTSLPIEKTSNLIINPENTEAAMDVTRRQGIISSTVKYIRLKKYQFEVTFCPYVLTPTEKFVFSKFLGLPCSGTIMAHVKHIDIILLTILSIVVMGVTNYLPRLLEIVFVGIWSFMVAMQSTKTIPMLSEMHL